jgi:hypothetical protein
MASGIICAGELKFNNCIIYYNEYDIVYGIMLAENASLQIKDSVVISKTTNDNMFIKGQGSNSVTIESTTFESCCNFIDLRLAKDVLVHKCTLRNCGNKLFVLQMNYTSNFEMAYSTIIIEYSNTIEDDKLPPFMTFNKYMMEVNSLKHRTCEFHNNRIIEKNNGYTRKINYLYGVGVNVSHCMFKGLSSYIIAWRFKDCIFKECNYPMRIGCSGGRLKGIIESCVFEKCRNVLDIREKTLVLNCRFRACSEVIIYGRCAFEGGIAVVNCKFIDIKNIDNFFGASIIFSRTIGKRSCENVIRYCIFDRVHLKNGFLVKADCFEDPRSIVTVIEKSYFKRYTTNMSCGRIIKEHGIYSGLHNRKRHFKANIVKDCKGLDKVKVYK